MVFDRVLVPLQIVGFLAALAALALHPPASGRMMLVPLSSAAAARVVPLALAGGAALIAVGPLRGSLIVSGERRRLSAGAYANGVLLLAAPAAACGANGGALA